MSTKVCSKCGIEKDISEFHKDKRTKSGRRSNCTQCSYEYNKKYGEIRREEIADWQHKYYISNRENTLESSNLYYLNNKEKIAKKAKIYAILNQSKISEYQKHYSATGKGKSSRKKAEQKYRAIKKGATIEDFSPTEIFERDGYICQLCGVKTRPDFKKTYHPLYPNLDHLIPLSKGGEHSRLNTQCLCHQCNIEKNNKEDFGDQMRLFG
jgi:5-methylcytosine-specific restriction endonuclease McrA